jgi:ribosomal protein S27AE
MKTDEERRARRRLVQRKYDQTEKGKLMRQRREQKYRQTEKYKARHRRAYKKYAASPKGRARALKYQATEKGRAANKRYRTSDGYRVLTRVNVKQWRKRNRIPTRVWYKVRDAKKDGKLVRQPCEVCGSPKTHAHHDDYARPLEVRWLCALHHVKWHKNLKNRAAVC